MKLTPYPFQLDDLATLRRNHYTGLIAIEAGGGKSLLAALAIAEAQPVVTLIIAPKSTHHTAWIPTLRDNANVTPRVIGNDNKATKSALFDFSLGYPGVYLASPQFVTRADVSSWRGDMLVIDEIHQGAVTPKSKLQRKVSGYHVNDGEPLNLRFHMRLALSATPMRGDFSNMWGVTKFLWGDTHYQRGQVAHENFILWQADRMSYQEVYTNQRDAQGNPKKVRQYLSESNPGRLLSELPCVIVHKRRETCCADPSHQGGFLPTEAPQIIERTVTLTPAQKKAVREMDQHMMTWIGANALTADISLTQKQRIRQLTLAEADVETYEVEGEERSRVIFDKDAKSPVIDEINHILSNLPEDEPVVVYTDSQKFAEVMVHQIDSAAEYSGVRKADLSGFGKDYRVLVGTVAAIGTGTAGLNHVSSTEIFADQPLSLTMFTQSSARLDRLDNTRRVQRYMILDDMDVQSGRMESLWAQEVMVARSMRVA
jgi:hypothetical protein